MSDATAGSGSAARVLSATRRASASVGGALGPYLLAAGFVVLIWQVAVEVSGAHVSILPPPAMAGAAFMKLAVSGELFEHSAISLGRVVAAWAMSALVAIPLGLAMGRSQRLERIVDPLVELFRPISPLAWIPLAILWFGIGETGKIFIIFIATFFPILLNTVSGVKRVDPVLVRAGRALGCERGGALFRRVIMPAAFPQIVVGLRISFGTGWAAIIAAELVAAQAGLGYLIADGMEILRSDLVLVGMVTIGVLGVLIDAAFRLLDRLVSWG